MKKQTIVQKYKMTATITITKNKNVCWCELCKNKIFVDENYLFIYKGAWKSPTGVKINLCLLCLEQINKKVDKKELKKIKLKRAEMLI